MICARQIRKDARRSAFSGATDDDARALDPYTMQPVVKRSWGWQNNSCIWREEFLKESRHLEAQEKAQEEVSACGCTCHVR